jgi:hypothetical protein
MKTLSKNWITEGLIDFEYKKYMLLAYLQDVDKCFNQIKLYPQFSDLVFHYQNLETVKKSQTLMREHFPKELTGTDLNQYTLVYKKLIQDDAFMKEIEEIIAFALPEFKRYLDEGSLIYQHIEDKLEIEPIGITPLYPNFGYVFLVVPSEPEMRIFEYKVTIFESITERYRGLNLTFLESVKKSVVFSYESIKIDLIRRQKKFGNPATYVIASGIPCPVEETLLPITKRRLVKYLANAA